MINIMILIPVVIRKPPRKDWIIVYLYNAITNIMVDCLLTKHNVIKYPVRFLANLFRTQILFDLLVYPTLTVVYNQVTYKDKPLDSFFKLFYFTIPMIIVETWAERKTKLIRWNRGWEWYHTFIGFTLKSFHTRLLMGLLRKMDERK
ncbi:hypothetical protein D7Z54_20615 [Salibacterium salarium]|uniref:Uncharacterized protein n=2 Tax=Salibacterium salarium TaxID=284579 RepID=A0A428MZB7_9BACI|nr:hypothetical protein D7Z54_20615 [Salibacterium salarium]